MTWRLIHADCIDAMRELGEASVDAIVTDPPYGLEFMGKEWDRLWSSAERSPDDWQDRPKGGTHPFAASRPQYLAGSAAQAWHMAWAAEALRVLKPGGHLLSFGGTRTYHRLACALEDAGFEIRDCLAYLYGSGFPKSLNVSKAIDKALGGERERVGTHTGSGYTKANVEQGAQGRETWEWAKTSDVAATPDAERWQGWGTALKPAFEPIVLARKPLSGTVAQNVLEFGVGALNVDGTRIGTEPTQLNTYNGRGPFGDSQAGNEYDSRQSVGRWPANVLLDADAAALLDEQSGDLHGAGFARGPKQQEHEPYEGWGKIGTAGDRGRFGDSGGASRFFKNVEPDQEKPPGRWPANVVLDEEAAAALDEQSGPGWGQTRNVTEFEGKQPTDGTRFGVRNPAKTRAYHAPNATGASRFFYTAKTSRAERENGVAQYGEIEPTGRTFGFKRCRTCGKQAVNVPGSACKCESPVWEDVATADPARNNHPTVKPVDLMQWLCRLITPPKGLILDPFTGSGSTGIAALREGFSFIGIEREADYVEIARARIIGDSPLFAVGDEVTA